MVLMVNIVDVVDIVDRHNRLQTPAFRKGKGPGGRENLFPQLPDFSGEHRAFQKCTSVETSTVRPARAGRRR